MDGKNFQREVAFEFDPPLILSQGGEEGLAVEEGRVHHDMEEEILCTLLRRRLLRLQDDGVGGEGVRGEAEQLHRGGLPDHDRQQAQTIHLHHPWPSGAPA